MTPAEQKQDAIQGLIRAAIAGGVIIVIAVFGYILLENIYVLLAGVAAEALIVVPAVLNLKKVQERNQDASG